jgi:RNA recognition motif-containing protein
MAMKGSKLYVGNLPYTTTSDELKEYFSAHGGVKEVTVIERKGFGFVEMNTPEEAENAKSKTDGQQFQGRALKVDEARPKEKSDRPNRNGGGGRGNFRF